MNLMISAVTDFFINFSEFLPHLLTILIAFAVFGAVFMLRRKIVSLLISFMKKICQRIPHADEILDSFTRPLVVLAAAVSGYLGIKILIGGLFTAQWSVSLLAFLATLMKAIVIVMVAWGLLRGSAPIISAIRGGESSLDQTIVSFLSNIVKVVIVLLATVMVMDAFDYDITGLITGLGITGLTVALAAQDTASNLFGGVIIIADKPFAVGDWIQTSSIEGIVEDISLRSTRVRTFKDAVIVVPNSTLSSTAIINWSQMNKRKVEMTLGFTYQTSHETLDTVISGIRKLLAEDPDVVDPVLVGFAGFNASSLDVSVNFFLRVTDLPSYSDAKERINFAIMDLCEKAGADFAYPTQTIFLEKNELTTEEPLKNE